MIFGNILSTSTILKENKTDSDIECDSDDSDSEEEKENDINGSESVLEKIRKLFEPVNRIDYESMTETIATGKKKKVNVANGRIIETGVRRTIPGRGLIQRQLDIEKVLAGKEGFIIGGRPTLQLIAPLGEYILACFSPPTTPNKEKEYGIIHYKNISFHPYNVHSPTYARILMPRISHEVRINAQVIDLVRQQEKVWDNAKEKINEASNKVRSIVVSLQRQLELAKNKSDEIVYISRFIIDKAFQCYYMYGLYEKYSSSDKSSRAVGALASIMTRAQFSICAALLAAKYALLSVSLVNKINECYTSAVQKADKSYWYIEKFNSIYRCYRQALKHAKPEKKALAEGVVDADRQLQKLEEEKKISENNG